jgi:hypothetical protein
LEKRIQLSTHLSGESVFAFLLLHTRVQILHSLFLAKKAPVARGRIFRPRSSKRDF